MPPCMAWARVWQREIRAGACCPAGHGHQHAALLWRGIGQASACRGGQHAGVNLSCMEGDSMAMAGRATVHGRGAACRGWPSWQGNSVQGLAMLPCMAGKHHGGDWPCDRVWQGRQHAALHGGESARRQAVGHLHAAGGITQGAWQQRKGDETGLYSSRAAG